MDRFDKLQATLDAISSQLAESNKMKEVLIIATCKAQAVSVCEYLKQFFTACVNGRTDYERSSLSRLLPTGRKNLTPMMLCQPVK